MEDVLSIIEIFKKLKKKCLRSNNNNKCHLIKNMNYEGCHQEYIIMKFLKNIIKYFFEILKIFKNFNFLYNPKILFLK